MKNMFAWYQQILTLKKNCKATRYVGWISFLSVKYVRSVIVDNY